MKTVGELIKSKGSNVLSTTPDSSVYDAIVKMAHHEIGALLVMEGDKVAGIFSERDYARKIILQDKSSKTTQVSEIMTSNVNYAEPDHSIEQCMSLMTQKTVSTFTCYGWRYGCWHAVHWRSGERNNFRAAINN